MIYCNNCGKESKGGILYRDNADIYNICNECKVKEENLTKHNNDFKKVCRLCGKEIKESPIAYKTLNVDGEYCEDCFIGKHIPKS